IGREWRRDRRLRSQTGHENENRGLPCARKIGGREWHADSVHQWTECTRRSAHRADEEDCGLPGEPGKRRQVTTVETGSWRPLVTCSARFPGLRCALTHGLRMA